MNGLARRMRRVSGEVEYLYLPKTVPEILEYLISLHQKYMDAEGDADYKKFREKFLKACRALGDLKRKEAHKVNQANTKQRFLQKYGIEVWREKVRLRSQRWRDRKKEQGLVRIRVDNKTLWVKAEEVDKYATSRSRRSSRKARPGVK